MTIGKFTWGTIKLVVNFIVVLVFGMTTYFIYSTITTLPLEVVAFEITPDGTNFGVDPMTYLADGAEGIGKVLKGDYFVTDETKELTISKKDAVTNGFSYFAFDYSSEYPAETVYKNVNMSNINLWLGKGTIAERYGFTQYDDYEYIDSKAFNNGERWSENEKYTAEDFPNAKEGDEDFKKIGKTWGEVDGPKKAWIGELKYQGGHPKISEDGQSLVAPTFSFQNYDDMVSGLTAAFQGENGQKVVDAILSYWIIRVGSQVDSYVQVRAQRLAGGGTGSGGLGAIQLSGELMAFGYNMDYYGVELSKSATIVVNASAKIGLTVLGPLLTTVDFTIAGWHSEANGGERFRYSSTAAGTDAQNKAVFSEGYTGVDGIWRSTDKTGALPTADELQTLYDEYVPEKTEYTNTVEGLKVVNEATGNATSEIRLCEFGMPADTYSDHIVDLRSIKEAETPKKPATNAFKAYTTNVVCYTYKDDPKWEWVSADNARGLADGIGGYSSNGGPVGYLYYTTLTIEIGVFESGFIRSWKTDEFWDASIAGLIEAKVQVGTNTIYTYDINNIMKDPLGLGMDLPGQIAKMQSVG
jgi:hypothetical protein